MAHAFIYTNIVKQYQLILHGQSPIRTPFDLLHVNHSNILKTCFSRYYIHDYVINYVQIFNYTHWCIARRDGLTQCTLFLQQKREYSYCLKSITSDFQQDDCISIKLNHFDEQIRRRLARYSDILILLQIFKQHGNISSEFY